MKAVLILGAAAVGIFVIQQFLSRNKRGASIASQVEEKVHQLQDKFKSLDEVQFDAAATGAHNSGFTGSLTNPSQP